MRLIRSGLALLSVIGVAACGMGTPQMTTMGETAPNAGPILTPERAALSVPAPEAARYSYQNGSLWNNGPTGLLGDKRARTLGDILTVEIEIDEEAEIQNESQSNRSGAQEANVGAFFGISSKLPESMQTLSPELEFGSTSDFKGKGSVKRSEKIALRIAATVVNVLPNGHLVIQGDQEVRVNNELRDLQVAGIVRPEDISRYNEIPYDRIASARISYGGRGQISTVQQPRWGQQIADKVMPY